MTRAAAQDHPASGIQRPARLSRAAVRGLTAAVLLAATMSAPALAAASAAQAATASAAQAATASAAQAAAVAAVRPGETVLAWGSNFWGQLGNGTTSDSSKPIAAKLPARFRYSTVRSQFFSLALATSGQLFAWGRNADGELGNGTTSPRLTPVRVPLPKGVKLAAVRAGSNFVLALTSTGKMLAWGSNASGQLGDGSVRNRLRPVWVKLPQGVTIKAISAGGDDGLALTTTGRVLSWGGDGAGQLGRGILKGRHLPGYVGLPRLTKITAIAAGEGTGFAVTSAGRLLAWGANGQGNLGDGTTKSRSTPRPVKLPKGIKVVAAVSGLLHTLALTTGGRVLAWGYNVAGQLGDNSTANRHVPVWVKLPKHTKITSIAAGRYFSLALAAGGRILAWGDNGSFELGTDSISGSKVPVRVPLPGGFTPSAIGAGLNGSSALAIGHQIRD
jgi:alpha-tubulin suppressor-like RCC1 family protein